MRSITTPAFLRALLLGSLGLPLQACGGRETGLDGGELDSDAGGSGKGGSGNGGSGNGGSGNGGSGDAGFVLGSACTNPQPLLAGVDTGIYRCAEGYLHRAEARECPTRLPRDIEILFPPDAGAPPGVDAGPVADAGTVVDECLRDTDCAGSNAFCDLTYPPQGACDGLGPFVHPIPRASRECLHGCRVDADCESSQVCICGEDIGHCEAVSPVAGCHSDADCDGAQCLSNARDGNFGPKEFACQLPGDACNEDRDCSPSMFCSMAETGRTCRGAAVCGRPFLVQHAARLANAACSDEWLDAVSARDLGAPSDVLAQCLADHWTRIALMEHASIAAFARFTLELLALGAPAALVRDATRAQADETRHATLAFGLATAYGGAAVGPGPLDLSGAFGGRLVEDVLRTTIQEGCIGETRAALEAAEAARHATVPHVKVALEGIARDEGEHAALGWRVVQWILAEHPELVAVAEDEFARAVSVTAGTTPTAAPADPEARAHGMLDAVALARVQSAAAHEVIAPCARALLARRSTSAPRPAEEGATV